MTKQPTPADPKKRKLPPMPEGAPRRLWDRYATYFYHTTDPFPASWEEWLQE